MLKNSYVNNEIVISVDGVVFVNEDNFSNGELYEVNSWDINKDKLLISNLSDIEELKKVKMFLLEKLNDNLFEDLTKENVFESIYISDNRLSYNQQCNANNEKPTSQEIEDFNNETINLYTQDIILNVKINNIDVEYDDLMVIMNLTI